MHAARYLAFAMITLASLTACEPEPQPTGPDRLSVTSGAPGDASSLANPDVPTFEVQGVTSTSGDRSPCVYDAATGQFVCPEVSRGGVTLTRRYSFRDAAGNPQSRFDAVTTESITTETTARGTATRPDGGTSTIDRSGVMVTSGLAGAETSRKLNGTEGGTVKSEFTGRDGAKVSVDAAITDSTVNLVIPVPRERNTPHWPLSGSRIHHTRTTTTVGGTSHTFSVRRKETFDGTSVVKVEITTADGTRNCTVDLAAKTTTCTR